MDKINIGKRLRDLRLQEGVTLEQIAADLGVTPQVVSFYELARRVPSDEVKIKYAKHYGCTVEELFFAGQY